MKDQMLISAEAIKAQMATAGGYVKSVNHVPVYATAIGAEGSADAAPSAQTGRYSRYRRPTRSTVPGLSTMSSSASASSGVKLIETVMGTEDDDLMSPMQATCLNAIRTAVATALAVGDEVMKAQNADHLKAKNKSSALGAKDMEALKAALEIEAIATLTTFGNALQFYLSTLDGDATIETGEVKEIITDNGRNALAGAIWELNDKIKAHHKKGKSIVCVLLSYCEDLLTRMESRFHAHPGIEAFTANAWAVEGESLVISGFEPAHRGKKSSIEMKRVAPEDVVGNAIAKAQCERLARMMTCYDFTAKKNPFAELGGYVFTFMGDGNPGTGKTTLIQMMGTMLGDICEMAGYPFLYENLSPTAVDSYQGKSGQNARAFVNNVMNPSVIGFGTIDDIDQVAGKRGDKQSSAGQQEITAVLMEAFAGAGTIVRGNCAFGMFSNYPENVDDALRQRAGARFLIDGPVTREDFADLMVILLGKNAEIPVGKHDPFATQQIKRAVRESYAKHDKPQEAPILAVYEDTVRQVGALDDLNKVSVYLKAIQAAEPRFTGRAIKNIVDAAKVRSMDFDMPDEWFQNPETFLHLPYDRKLAMIKDLQTPLTAAMLLQEANRYADSEARYSGKSDEAEIAKMVRQAQLSMKAQKRLHDIENGIL